MKLNYKYFLFIFIIFEFINLIKSQNPLDIKELYYNNNSKTFWGYPTTTSSNHCIFNIPFSINSTEKIILVSPTNFFINTSISTDSRNILGTLTNSPSLSTLVGTSEVNITVTTIDGLQYIYSYYFICQNFNDIQISVLNSGTFYQKLALTIQVKGLPNNVQLDFDTKVDKINQINMGNNIYFISFNNNNNSMFQTAIQNKDYFLNISTFSKSFPILLKINSIFKFPNFNQPTTNFYQTNNIIQLFDAPYLEISNFTSTNNYFVALTNLTYPQSIYFDEPYLKSSIGKNAVYMVPLATSFLQPTSYYLDIMFYYPNLAQPRTYRIQYEYNQTNFKLPDYSIPISPTINNNDYIFYYSFSNINIPIIIGLGEISTQIKMRFPFAFDNGNSTTSLLKIPIRTLSNRKKYINFQISYDQVIFSSTLSPNDNNQPLGYPFLVQYFCQLIPKGQMILLLKTNSTPTILDSIAINTPSDNKIYPVSEVSTFQSDINGNLQVIQINLPRMLISSIVLRTIDLVETKYIVDPNYKYVIDNQITSLTSIYDLDKLPSNFNYISALKSVRFYNNDLKVTNTSIPNKMYITLDNFPIEKEVKVTFIYSDYSSNEKKDIVYSNYNSLTSSFEFEFIVPKNIKTGNVTYIITLDSIGQLNYYSYSLTNEYQLRIAESNTVDLMGPIVENIFQTKMGSIDGWNIILTDITNGFKNGYVIVKGSVDMSEKNITLNSSNQLNSNHNGSTYSEFFIPCNYTNPCVTQNFTIVYAYFEDTEGFSTIYEVGSINKRNPFLKYVGTSKMQSLSINFVCDPLPTTNRLLLQLTSFNLVEAANNCNTLKFNYTAYYPIGISANYLPTVYVSSSNLRYIASTSTLISNSNSTHTSFTSILNIPFNFDIDNPLSFLVYGIVSNDGYIKGYNNQDLSSKNFQNSYTCTRNTSLPIITSSSELLSSGVGGLWIYGSLLYKTTIIQIKYTNDANDDFVNYDFKFVSQSATTIHLNSIKATNNPIYIRIGNSYGFSDPYLVLPKIINLTPIVPSNNTSLCKGSPLCGGSSNGQCLDTGCKCISPWIGEDCLSKVIQVPPPTINENNPSTNITIDNKFSSIISIVGIKELDIQFGEVHKYIFTSWEYKLISNNTVSEQYAYFTTIKKNGIDVSNITVLMSWYKTEASISFAGEEIELYPSSMKYTIEITSYPFDSKLNSLQLIMKASFISSDSDSCSSMQLDSSLGDNSDYLKFSIDNHSFYGRFIKKIIIDNNIISTATNNLLDSSMNIINSNQYDDKNSETYIGITIGQFLDNVQLDPNFNNLLNSYSIKCKSGLTKAQLAGIIVGSIAFFIVVIIIVVSIIYKSSGCLSIKIFIYKNLKKKSSK